MNGIYSLTELVLGVSLWILNIYSISWLTRLNSESLVMIFYILIADTFIYKGTLGEASLIVVIEPINSQMRTD